jgi:plasmid stability protein
MATLNVKNFPDPLYEKLREMAEREHRSVAQQVVHLIEQATASAEPRSLLELFGLGREAWREIEAAEYVEAERKSWD